MRRRDKRQNAGVAELADAQASGACGRKIVWVQVPSPASFFINFLSISVQKYPYKLFPCPVFAVSLSISFPD